MVERRADVRSRIVDEAARLLSAHGPAGVTTRGVSDAAGVQAPTIYRLFGDKDGLLEAVAEHVMASHVTAKAAIVAAAEADGRDPLDDLRSGWHAQVEFGLTNPAVFRLLSDPARVLDSAAARSGRRVLTARIHRVALTGRLAVAEDRAVDLMMAAGVGTIQTLLASPVDRRDPGLPEAMYDTVLRTILTDGTVAEERGAAAAAAVALRAAAPDLAVLSGSEQRLLAEWLDRVIDAV